VVGIFRSGLKRVDEGQIYSLISLAQTLIGQSGIINQLRLRLNDPVVRTEGSDPGRSADWIQVGVVARANADLLSTFATRDFIVLTVMGAMLLTSSFATYNIISPPSPHEKRHDNRDHEVAGHARVFRPANIHH